LDAPFNAYPIPCTGANQQYRTEGGYERDYVIAPDTITASYKTFEDDFAPYSLSGTLAGIGVVWRQQTKLSDAFEELAYVRVSGAEYGSVLFDLPTSAGEIEPDFEVGPSVYVAPNPASRSVSIRVSITNERGNRSGYGDGYRLEIVDAIGRTVVSELIQAISTQSTRLSVAMLPPGLYVLRARSFYGETLATGHLIVSR
jgi:hypothetical protein